MLLQADSQKSAKAFAEGAKSQMELMSERLRGYESGVQEAGEAMVESMEAHSNPNPNPNPNPKPTWSRSFSRRMPEKRQKRR